MSAVQDLVGPIGRLSHAFHWVGNLVKRRILPFCPDRSKMWSDLYRAKS